MQNSISKTFCYEGNNISFKKGGYVMVLATEMGRAFGKNATDWLTTFSVRDYIKELSDKTKLSPSDLLEITYSNKRGTWIHEDIAMKYAQWLSPLFATWCAEHIKKIKELSVETKLKYTDNFIEEWREIPGYNGRYRVSNLGRIKQMAGVAGKWGNKRPVKEIILSTRPDTNGYITVVMRDSNNISHTQLVHRLIALAFIPNPHNYPVINHLNEIKSDNRIENLEWCTIEHNANWGTKNHRVSVKRGRPIVGIVIPDGEQVYFHSYKEAIRHGFRPLSISKRIDVLYFPLNSSRRWVWKWADDKDYIVPQVRSLRHSITGVSISDGSVIHFDSLLDAQKSGYHYLGLKKALANKKPYRGYIWKYNK